MNIRKTVAFLLCLLLLPLPAFASEVYVPMPETEVIDRRLSQNTARTLKYMPDAARERTDTLVIGVSDLMGELNPFWTATAGDSYAISLLYDELLFSSNSGQMGAGVASYALSADLKTYTFTLQDNVHYADGTALLSDDFINAFYLVLMPGYDGVYDLTRAGIVGVEAYLAGEAPSIEGIVRIDEKKFSITVGAANENHLIFFALPALRVSLFGAMQRPETLTQPEAFDSFYQDSLAAVRSADATQMAYGQYLLTEMQPGEMAAFTKHEGYWRGAPFIGEVQLLVVAAEQEVAAILDGIVDIISTLGSVEKVDVVVDFETGFINLYTWPGDVIGFLNLNLENPLFADGRVRQALAVGFDREAARMQRIERYGNVPGTLLFDSFSPTTAKTLGEQYGYDLERAAALLQEAGWEKDDAGMLAKDGEPLAFTLVYNQPNPIMELMVPQMVSDYAALGIEVTPQAVSFEALLEVLETGAYDVCFEARRLPHSEAIAADLFAGKSHLNRTGFDSDMAERLLDMAAKETDPQRQTLIYEMLFQEVYLELPFVPLYRRSEFLLVNARVMNVVVTTSHEITSDVYRFFLTDTLEGQW